LGDVVSPFFRSSFFEIRQGVANLALFIIPTRDAVCKEINEKVSKNKKAKGKKSATFRLATKARRSTRRPDAPPQNNAVPINGSRRRSLPNPPRRRKKGRVRLDAPFKAKTTQFLI